MENYLIEMAYDGSGYHGWQIQKNAVTVQEVFQDAVVRVLGERPELKACSRTDTGVHARSFFVSMKSGTKIPPDRLVPALNRELPKDLTVRSCRRVAPTFHARYDCLGKEYQYQIWNHSLRDPFLKDRALHYWWKLDETRLDQAAKYYIGRHDFSSFCTLDRRKMGDLTRTVFDASVRRQGDLLIFSVSADGFLYHMVRIMTGTLLRVGEGKLSPEELPEIIAAKNRDRAGPTAPACGLYLHRVFYEPDQEKMKKKT